MWMWIWMCEDEIVGVYSYILVFFFFVYFSLYVKQWNFILVLVLDIICGYQFIYKYYVWMRIKAVMNQYDNTYEKYPPENKGYV